MPSNFAKPIWDLGEVKYLNSGAGDAVLGGLLTGVPSGIAASQGRSNRPGDRIILGHADALALSDTSIGTLYGGLYQYVQTVSGTATYNRGKLVFRYTTAATSAEDQLHKVVADETQGQGANLRAGVIIQTLVTPGYYCWIQVAGKMTVWFKTTITGTAADGCGVYNAAQGAGADVGKVDVLAGADMGNNTALYYGIVDNMMKRYLGIALGAPTNNNLCLVDAPIRHFSF